MITLVSIAMLCPALLGQGAEYPLAEKLLNATLTREEILKRSQVESLSVYIKEGAATPYYMERKVSQLAWPSERHLRHVLWADPEEPTPALLLEIDAAQSLAPPALWDLAGRLELTGIVVADGARELVLTHGIQSLWSGKLALSPGRHARYEALEGTVFFAGDLLSACLSAERFIGEYMSEDQQHGLVIAARGAPGKPRLILRIVVDVVDHTISRLLASQTAGEIDLPGLTLSSAAMLNDGPPKSESAVASYRTTSKVSFSGQVFPAVVESWSASVKDVTGHGFLRYSEPPRLSKSDFDVRALPPEIGAAGASVLDELTGQELKLGNYQGAKADAKQHLDSLPRNAEKSKEADISLLDTTLVASGLLCVAIYAYSRTRNRKVGSQI